jgi:hypothetical protein
MYNCTSVIEEGKARGRKEHRNKDTTEVVAG